MEAVAEAARKARYNEAIIVNVTSSAENSDETRELVLVATLDENGGVVWNEATSVAVDEDVGIVRHLRTKRWVLPMLNDRRRNELYDEAIRSASREAVRRVESNGPLLNESIIHALDIGTGTALLAMMSCKHLQAALASSDTKTEDSDSIAVSPRVQVTSLEMASAMARLAKLTITSNDLHNSIEVLEEHSCEANLQHKFVMCTSELLETGLLGEGILPSLRDAWQRHLHPDAVVVPQKARVYVQLIESSELVANYRGPHSPPQASNSVGDSSSLRLSTSLDASDVLLGGNVTVPIHAQSLFTSDQNARLLTDPAEAMAIDFSREKIPGPEGQRQITSLMPTASGVAHGVLFWWELDLWGDLSYSTQQGKEPWQDHWHQCLCVFGECTRVKKGEAINLTCSHTDNRLLFALESSSESQGDAKRQRVEVDQSPSIARLVSPERALQLNDHNRLDVIRRAVRFALETKRKDIHFLDVSDFSLCAILAALEGGTFVSSLESSSGTLPMTSARVSQANALPRTHDGKVAQYQILQCHTGSLTCEVFNNEPAAIVAAEPYYEVLEGWHLQEALNYFYLVRSLRKRGLVEKNVMSIPSYASIMVCGIQCETLAQAYQGCGDGSEDATICGFKHSDVKYYGDRYDQHGLPIRACEYDYTQLTESRQISRLCFDESSSIGHPVETKLKFQRAGTCHGILSWIDYGLQVNTSEQAILSTYNMQHRQLFQLLPNPEEIPQEGLGDVTLVCRLQLGELDGAEDHRFEACIVTN